MWLLVGLIPSGNGCREPYKATVFSAEGIREAFRYATMERVQDLAGWPLPVRSLRERVAIDAATNEKGASRC